jgi:hypothetical protein
MNPEKETEQTETPVELTETTPETEQLHTSEESSDSQGPAFEEPDFGAITDFVESGDEDEVPPATADSEVTEDLVEEDDSSPEEPAEPVPSEGEEPEAEEVKEPEPELQPEAVKLPTREDLEGMYKEHRAKTLPELEKIFTLSDEEAAALDEQPSKVLPKLAAQLQYDVMLSTYNAVISALPTVVGTLNHASQVANTAHSQFMEAWPDLNNDKAVPVVKASIQAYRSANPRATLQETIKGAGVMAMINLGLDPTPKASAAPAVPARPKVVPPRPVSPTGQSPVPPVSSNEEKNEFTELAEVFLNDMS